MKRFTEEDIGKKFRRRNGDVVTCTEIRSGVTIFDSGCSLWASNGRAALIGKDHPDDIVEEISAPKPAKVYEEVQKVTTAYVYGSEHFPSKAALLSRIEDDVQKMIEYENISDLDDSDFAIIETMVELARELRAARKDGGQ